MNPFSLVVIALLAVSELLLATAVFMVIVRPECVHGWVDRWVGAQRHPTEQDDIEDAAPTLRIAGALLFVLFVWSFMLGAVMRTVQL